MITFEKARLAGNVQRPGMQLSNNLRVVTELTAKVAVALDARWLLFDKESVIRSGFTKTDLDSVFVGATFTHEIAKIGKLELVGCEVSKFVVFRTGDGKKKPKRLMVAFTVKYSGGCFDLIEHLARAGKGEGVSSVSAPQQEKLFGNDKPAEDGPAKGFPTPNEHGFFEKVKPVKRYKSNDKKWHAELYLVETEKGWEQAAGANTNTGSFSHPLRVTDEPFASEAEALAYAANCVVQYVRDRCEVGSAASKREARKMRDWAVEFARPK